MKLKSGDAGKAQVQAKGKGVNVPTPALPLTLPVTVQLLIGDGGTNNTPFLQAAIDSLSDMGGEVQVSGGEYDFSSVVTTAKRSVAITGPPVRQYNEGTAGGVTFVAKTDNMALLGA